MEYYDVVVIGSGPSGQKAAIQGTKLGQRVLVIEQDVRVGGACVHYGTIPSKTLRESAQSIVSFKQRCAAFFDLHMRKDLEVAHLMSRLQRVVHEHERYMGEQLQRNGVTQWHGRARFVSPHALDVLAPDGSQRHVTGISSLSPLARGRAHRRRSPWIMNTFWTVIRCCRSCICRPL